jgi:hypothetical protein
MALIPSHSFPAFGIAPQDCQLVYAVLLDRDDQQVGQAITLCQPTAPDYFWSIAFTRVPRERFPFTIQLFNAEQDDVPLAVVRYLAFHHGYYGTGISYPLPSSGPISSSFTAYGTTNQANVTAQMVLAGQAPVDSVAVLNGGGWFANFRTLQSNANWTINAFDTANPVAAGHPADFKTPINVQGG